MSGTICAADLALRGTCFFFSQLSVNTPLLRHMHIQTSNDSLSTSLIVHSYIKNKWLIFFLFLSYSVHQGPEPESLFVICRGIYQSGSYEGAHINLFFMNPLGVVQRSINNSRPCIQWLRCTLALTYCTRGLCTLRI